MVCVPCPWPSCAVSPATNERVVIERPSKSGCWRSSPVSSTATRIPRPVAVATSTAIARRPQVNSLSSANCAAGSAGSAGSTSIAYMTRSGSIATIASSAADRAPNAAISSSGARATTATPRVSNTIASARDVASFASPSVPKSAVWSTLVTPASACSARSVTARSARAPSLSTTMDRPVVCASGSPSGTGIIAFR